MGKPHKHAELIKAWADGAEIEVYEARNDVWYSASDYPCWDEAAVYRVRHSPVKVKGPKYRRFAIIKNGQVAGVGYHFENNVQYYGKVCGERLEYIDDDWQQDEVEIAKKEAERIAALNANSKAIEYMNAQANMKIAECVANGKVNTIVVPMDFKGIVNTK